MGSPDQKKKDKKSHKQLFQESQSDSQEGVSLLDSVSQSDLSRFNSGGPGHQGSASFSDASDDMELTLLTSPTVNNHTDVAGEEKKDQYNLDEENPFAQCPVLYSITEEKTAEEEDVEDDTTIPVEEDATNSIVTFSDWLMLLSFILTHLIFCPKNNLHYFSGYFSLPLLDSIYSITPALLKISAILFPLILGGTSTFEYSFTQIFEQIIGQSAYRFV